MWANFNNTRPSLILNNYRNLLALASCRSLSHDICYIYYECSLSISFHLQDVAQIQLGLSRPSGKSHLDLLNAMATRLTDSNHYREFLRKERRKMIWIKLFKENDLKLCHLEESVKWLSCLVTTILNMNYLIIVFHWLIKKKDLCHSHLMPLGII